MAIPVPVDPAVWWALSGFDANIPSISSIFYYFREGNPDRGRGSSSVSLKVVSVSLMFDPERDEIFARILLDPNLSTNGGIHHVEAVESPAEMQLHSKILTKTDACNGSGLNLPKACAENIFPPLDLTFQTFQILEVKDLAGKAFKFHHVYPKKHMLTTGWYKFVNEKNLVFEDIVTFVKKSPQEIFIGVTHINRRKKAAAAAEEEEEAAAAFEVDYYPRMGNGDFFVKAEEVEEASLVQWTCGMRVRSRREVGRSGTVKMTGVGPKRGSPWKSLRIKWDDMENTQDLSPWEVAKKREILLFGTVVSEKEEL